MVGSDDGRELAAELGDLVESFAAKEHFLAEGFTVVGVCVGTYCGEQLEGIRGWVVAAEDGSRSVVFLSSPFSGCVL